MKHSKGQGWFICQSLDPFCVKKKTNPKTQEPQTNIQPHTSMHKKCWQSVKLLITDENIDLYVKWYVILLERFQF